MPQKIRRGNSGFTNQTTLVTTENVTMTRNRWSTPGKTHGLFTSKRGTQQSLVGAFNPSEKYEFVSWDDRNSQYFWENQPFMATSYHQPGSTISQVSEPFLGNRCNRWNVSTRSWRFFLSLHEVISAAQDTGGKCFSCRSISRCSSRRLVPPRHWHQPGPMVAISQRSLNYWIYKLITSYNNIHTYIHIYIYVYIYICIILYNTIYIYTERYTADLLCKLILIFDAKCFFRTSKTQPATEPRRRPPGFPQWFWGSPMVTDVGHCWPTHLGCNKSTTLARSGYPF